MAKIRVQRHEGLTVVGLLGLREGKTFRQVHLEFSNGRYVTKKFLGQMVDNALSKGIHQRDVAENSDRGRFLVVSTKDSDGRIVMDVFFTNQDDTEETVHLDADTVREIQALLSQADSILHVYDQDLLVRQADEKAEKLAAASAA
jgi:hypothetical protein